MSVFKSPVQKVTVLASIMLAMWLLWEKGFKNVDWGQMTANIQKQEMLGSDNASIPADDGLVRQLLLRVEILEKEVQLLKAKK